MKRRALMKCQKNDHKVTNPPIYHQLIFYKQAKITHWRKISTTNTVGKIISAHTKVWNKTPNRHSIQKSPVDQAFDPKIWDHQISRGKQTKCYKTMHKQRLLGENPRNAGNESKSEHITSGEEVSDPQKKHSAKWRGNQQNGIK